MESLGVYEDLSLFNGDLVGFGSPPDKYSALAPDGLPDGLMYHSLEQSTTVTSSDDLHLQGAGIEDDDWMEKKMDLIKLLSNPKVQVTIVPAAQSSSAVPVDFNQIAEDVPVFYQSSEPLSPVFFFDEDQTSREDSLQNFADLLSLDFHVTEKNVSSHAPASSHSQLGFSAFAEQDTSSFDNDSFLSFLTEEELSALEAPILSPVSAEDVESILSSMPSTPHYMSGTDAVSVFSNDDSVAGPPATGDQYALSAVVPKDEFAHSPVPDDVYSLSPVPSEEYQRLTPVPADTADLTRSAVGPTRSVRSSRLKKYSPYQDCLGGDDDDCAHSTSRTGRKRHDSSCSERKQRKKQQNKDAALRYRMKKKEEQGSIFSECDALEKTNSELKGKVDGMEREIQYLKELLLDVYEAKGIQPPHMLVNSK